MQDKCHIRHDFPIDLYLTKVYRINNGLGYSTKAGAGFPVEGEASLMIIYGALRRHNAHIMCNSFKETEDSGMNKIPYALEPDRQTLYRRFMLSPTFIAE
jgi:hypothetical protein